MHCHVYASIRKSGTYLWLDDPQRLEKLPDALCKELGGLRLVLELELDSDRVLPRQETGLVLDNLRARGWYLQLPPGETRA